MSISDRSKTDFDRAKIKLTGHFDRRPIGRYIEPWREFKLFGLAPHNLRVTQLITTGCASSACKTPFNSDKLKVPRLAKVIPMYIVT
jgi:hypothetical protein